MKRPYKKPNAQWLSFKVNESLMDVTTTTPEFSTGVGDWLTQSVSEGNGDVTFNENGTISRS